MSLNLMSWICPCNLLLKNLEIKAVARECRSSFVSGDLSIEAELEVSAHGLQEGASRGNTKTVRLKKIEMVTEINAG